MASHITPEVISWSQQMRWYPKTDAIQDDEGGYLVAKCRAKTLGLPLRDKIMRRDFEISISIGRPAGKLENSRREGSLANDAIGGLSFTDDDCLDGWLYFN